MYFAYIVAMKLYKKKDSRSEHNSHSRMRIEGLAE